MMIDRGDVLMFGMPLFGRQKIQRHLSPGAMILRWYMMIYQHDIKHNTASPTSTNPNWHSSSEQGSPCFELWCLLNNHVSVQARTNYWVKATTLLGSGIIKVLCPEMVYGQQQTWSLSSGSTDLMMHTQWAVLQAVKHPVTSACSPWVVSSHLLKTLW